VSPRASFLALFAVQAVVPLTAVIGRQEPTDRSLVRSSSNLRTLAPLFPMRA
jgi:hypothetical protein